MNGIKLPAFIDRDVAPGYYRKPDSYSNPPSCNVNLLELSRYAKKNGKTLAKLDPSEVMKFAI